MQIIYKASSDCDYFYFEEINDVNIAIDKDIRILLPQSISIGDLICFIQSSLDQVRPVVLLNSQCAQETINLLECKKKHYEFVEHIFLYLNFSVRNSLSIFKKDEGKVISFDEIQKTLVQKLQKNI